jgi:hypothetical protein
MWALNSWKHAGWPTAAPFAGPIACLGTSVDCCPSGAFSVESIRNDKDVEAPRPSGRPGAPSGQQRLPVPQGGKRFFSAVAKSFALFKRWRREKSPDTPTIGMLRDLAVRWARRTGKHSSNASHGDQPGVSRDWHRPGRGDESCRRRVRRRDTGRSCARGPACSGLLGANLSLRVSYLDRTRSGCYVAIPISPKFHLI